MLARFPRSHLTSKSFVKSWMCSYERAGWLGCRDLGCRDLGFSSRDLGKRAGNAAISTVQPCYRDELFEWILHCLALPLYFLHHKHPIWQQWYSFQSFQSCNRRESYNFVFHHVCFVSRISHHNSSSAFSSRKPGWNFAYEPTVKRAHVKRP